MYFILYIRATNYNYIILSVNGMINMFEVTLYLSLDVSTFKYQRSIFYMGCSQWLYILALYHEKNNENIMITSWENWRKNEK